MTPNPHFAVLPPDVYVGERPRVSARLTQPVGAPKTVPAAAMAWSAYWHELDPDHRPLERCYVPGDGRMLVDRHWAEFADGLPFGSRVIDLGCGAGILGRLLLSRRCDLRVTGVDWAEVPAARQPNLTICPRMSMEALSFEDGRFDAAVSLFGIEYGDIGRTAQELARVLRSGARFSFLIHHRDSEIAQEGAARRRALRQLSAGRMKRAFLAGSLAGLDDGQRRLKAQFPGQTMVDLVSNHYRRHLARARSERLALWQTLADDLDLEIGLLALLERSAKSASEMGVWLVSLLSAMQRVNLSVLRRGSGEPIAWAISGNR